MHTLTQAFKISTIKDVIKAFAITISVALAFYVVTMSSLSLYINSMLSPLGNISFRPAGGLKVLAFLSPWAGIGYGIGVSMTEITNNTILRSPFGVFINPMLQTLTCLAMYFVSKKWGRSAIKDMFLLACAGVLSVVFVSLGKAITTSSLLNADYLSVFMALFTIKVITVPIAHMSGYPLYRAIAELWKLISKRLK